MKEVKCWKRGDKRRTKNYCYPARISGDVATSAMGQVYKITAKGWVSPVTLKKRDGSTITVSRREYKTARLASKRSGARIKKV